ncbi:hypothetical protein D7V86_23555 [bacterium D16-51]|nr:hypothetical protein D7V96_21370 [bacterium D16-59]RKI54441.1 hypothetical protein D7V86_23555 [bacterium D16-51]
MRKKCREIFYLSPKEEMVMKVLWDTEDALSASEMAERIPNRDWPVSSAQNLLRSLEKKNAIRVAAITKLAKAYGRVFRPTLSANEYASMLFGRYYQNGKKDYEAMVLALFEEMSVGKKEMLETMQKIIDTHGKGQ